MSKTPLSERREALYLSLTEAYVKKDECQSGINNLNRTLTKMDADNLRYRDKEETLDSIESLLESRSGWQDTIDSTLEKIRIDLFINSLDIGSFISLNDGSNEYQGRIVTINDDVIVINLTSMNVDIQFKLEEVVKITNTY